MKPGEPAGDRLVVAVLAPSFDADHLRLPVRVLRKGLQLTIEAKGNLKGVQRDPLEPDSTGTSVYTAAIWENRVNLRTVTSHARNVRVTSYRAMPPRPLYRGPLFACVARSPT